MKIIYFIIFGFLIPMGIASQSIQGKVIDNLKNPLQGASVYWLNSSIATLTDSTGHFEIQAFDQEKMKLIATFVGYTPDTLEVNQFDFVEFNLYKKSVLDEVIIKGQRDGVIISQINPIKTEQITQSELKKAACCDLAGCFDTQTTVQPQTTNVVTNSKELRMLGLSGVYNQILIDGLPLIQGLTYTYGISSIPGTLVDNIYVAKGANSVLQGFESISGQINVETKDPDNTETVMINAYVNSFMEKHFNVNYAFKHKKWSNLTAVHTVLPAGRIDRDDDQFMDLPQISRFKVFNKWKYGNKNDWGWYSTVGLGYLRESRTGGQILFDEKTDRGSTSIYGQTLSIHQPEMTSSTGYRFNDTHHVGVNLSALHQDQDSYFGSTNYIAQQTQLYANVQYELNYEGNQFKTGFSYRHLDISEDIAFTDTFLHRTYNGLYHRIEKIPGMFFENTMHFFNKKLTWMTGMRMDHHNQFGFMYTPRSLLKFDLNSNSSIRANVGTGWRTTNLFSENIGLLASSRDIIFIENLQPERAVNFGINLTHKFETTNENLSGYLSADFYRTEFLNQIFPDYDIHPTKAYIYNFTGESVSHVFQLELNIKLWKRYEIKGGYNYMDVYRMIEDQKLLLPFNPRHRVLGTFSYKPESSPFQFDLNAHWYGEQRLPDTQSNPSEFQRPDFSNPFTIINAQFTYYFKSLEIYAGCENIFDFRQHQPIISWQDPFSPYFDTSSVWGPTRGRELYMGFRYRLKKD